VDTPTYNPFDLKKSLNFTNNSNQGENENLYNLENMLNANFKLDESETDTNLQNNKLIKPEEKEENKNTKIKEIDSESNDEIEGNFFTKIFFLLIKNTEEQTTELSNDLQKEVELISINNIIEKKKTAGFSNFYKRNTVNIIENSSMISLGLDIEAINEKYQFGGDKHKLNISEEETQKKIEEKIKLLAEHCVKFMNGEINQIKCLDFSSDIFFREKELEREFDDGDKNMNKFPHLYNTENE
jgi:hypothetical protein